MLIYIYIIAASGLFAYLAQRYYSNKLLFILTSALAVLIPSFFSGMRDLDVGYDVMYYEFDAFQNSLYSKSFYSLLTFEDGLEPGFLLINYFSSRLSDDIHLALGIISFFICLFIYLSCVRCRKQCPIWLLYTICLLYNYASSNNLMRQTLAASICFYAFTYLRDYGLKWQYILLSILALSCHNTAIVPIIVFLVYYIIPKVPLKRLSFFFYSFILGCITIYFMFTQLLSLFSNYALKDYSIYGDSSQNASWAQAHVSLSILVLLFFCTYILFYMTKKPSKLPPFETYKYKVTIVLCLLSTFLGNYTGSAARLLLYFIFILMFYLCYIINLQTLSIGKRLCFNFIVLTIFVYLHFKLFYDGLEYKSFLLGIKG